MPNNIAGNTEEGSDHFLILRGEDQKDHQNTRAERDARSAAAAPFLKRFAAPVVAHVGRQHKLCDPLHCSNRLPDGFDV